MKYPVYTEAGKEKGEVTLPERIFGLSPNNNLVHVVTYSMEANARHRTAQAKTRGEVRGGGKKPWKQKGTGRARHGSSRSPIWVGGGTTHGPRADKNYSKKINKKAAAKALFTVLSGKVRDKELLLVEDLAVEGKTKLAQAALSKLSGIKGFEMLAKKNANAALLVVLKKTPDMKRAFANIGSVKLEEARNINVLDALRFRHIVIANPKESIAVLEQRVTSKK